MYATILDTIIVVLSFLRHFIVICDHFCLKKTWCVYWLKLLKNYFFPSRGRSYKKNSNLNFFLVSYLWINFKTLR